MNFYELYINDVRCDIQPDEVVLEYQSPIFAELDTIQSNRSYNIKMSLHSSKNRKALLLAERVDMNSRAPYSKLSAQLYNNGACPVFTRGFATITGIEDTASITLTWGNVDNFQPLFDKKLSDLGPTLYQMGRGSIPWNAQSTLVSRPAESSGMPPLGFYAIDYGMGIENMKYVHPSVAVHAVLSAIEQANDITIEDKGRLVLNDRSGEMLYLPLTEKYGDENNEALLTYYALLQRQGMFQFRSYCKDQGNVSQTILTSKGEGNYDVIDVSEVTTMRLEMNNYTGIYPYVEYKNIYDNPVANNADSLRLIIWGSSAPNLDNATMLLEIPSIHCTVGRDYTMWLLPRKNAEIEVAEFDYVLLQVQIIGTKTPGELDGDVSDYHFDGGIALYGEWEKKLLYPSFKPFPVAPNLPDMSQGDFIQMLMLMHGLFAYSDNSKPNIIRLMSPDEFYKNIDAGNYLDWSRKVLLNEQRDTSRPDASEFRIGDYAQKNILDYDNDEGIRIKTEGTIEINDINLEHENEYRVPLSASDNVLNQMVEDYIAKIPLYEIDGENVNENSVSNRIVGVRILNDTIHVGGYFHSGMRFGGKNGIISRHYNTMHKLLNNLRIITVRLKLTALDLYNLNYSVPVFLDQFGQYFAVYQVKTSYNRICTCKLIKL